MELCAQAILGGVLDCRFDHIHVRINPLFFDVRPDMALALRCILHINSWGV